MPESPLCALARARGGAAVEVEGWTVPSSFGDPAGEHRALAEDAALVDLAYRARVRVSGPDRLDFLQGMLSNDVKALAPGRGCSTLLLSEHGKVVADCLALAFTDHLLLDGVASAVSAAVATLERYVVADDVAFTPVEPPDHALGIFGPRATASIERLGARAPTEPYAHAAAALAGVEARVVRVPSPGAGGVLCLVPAAAVAACWSRCEEVGVRPAGHEALEALRIEGGTPAYGRDFGLDTLALEAPLEAAISFRKGCYLGQEVMERVSARGHVNRKLVALEIGGARVPAPGDEVLAGGREVGRVTSAAWSWRLGRPVALGYVRREHLASGTTLEIRGASGVAPATVRALPLVPAASSDQGSHQGGRHDDSAR